MIVFIQAYKINCQERNIEVLKIDNETLKKHLKQNEYFIQELKRSQDELKSFETYLFAKKGKEDEITYQKGIHNSINDFILSHSY